MTVVGPEADPERGQLRATWQLVREVCGAARDVPAWLSAPEVKHEGQVLGAQGPWLPVIRDPGLGLDGRRPIGYTKGLQAFLPVLASQVTPVNQTQPWGSSMRRTFCLGSPGFKFQRRCTSGS